MKIREATITDRENWNAFVDSQEGHLYQYFDWKYVMEKDHYTYFQLILEECTSKISGILAIGKKNTRWYSTIISFSVPLLRKDLSKEEKYKAMKMFFKYLDDNYSRGCSTSKLLERIPIVNGVTADPIQAILDSGYRSRYDKTADLPCDFVLELTPPFEKNIWMGLWPHKTRQILRKVERKRSVTVVVDKEMRYSATYLEMAIANRKRHRTTPYLGKKILTEFRESMSTELKVFKDKIKLFVALEDNTPVVFQLCLYTPSTCYLLHLVSFTKFNNDIEKYVCKVAIEDACNSGYRYIDFGTSSEPGSASQKEMFRGTRILHRNYEKRYSIIRYLFELIPLSITYVLSNKKCLWAKRKKILDYVFRW